jgi:hypothetical protein
MGTAIQQELGDMLCPVHHLPPQVIVSLSRSGGLQAQVRGCCDVLVKTTTAPLRRTIKQTAPFGTPTDLIIRVVDSDQSWTIDVNEIEELVIGRSDPSSETPPGIDLVGEGATEKGVSRRHATIFWWDGALHIADSGSTNHTYLNERQLAPHARYPLRDGDQIRLGELILQIEFALDTD